MSKFITKNDLKAIFDKILPSDQVDYVIEQGKSGDWSYRKWNSGEYEAWCTYSDTANLTTQSAGTYYGTSINVAPPTFSSSILHCQATPKSSLGSGVFIYKYEANSGSTALDFRAHVSTSNAAVSAYLYIRGTY